VDCPEPATEVIRVVIAETISASTVRRILAGDAIKPWQHRSWITMRAPDFAAKAKPVLDLYQRCWDGEPLGADEYIISSDEKTSIQARCRCHPTLPPGAARAMRVEHDYQRGGAVAYLAAYDVHRANVIGRCEPTTGIVPFEALVEQVMSQQPYASAKRVFWVVDNGSSHRGQAAIDRMAQRSPNCVLVHTPVHGSRLVRATGARLAVVDPAEQRRQQARKLEMVVGAASALPQRPAGELAYPTFRSLTQR